MGHDYMTKVGVIAEANPFIARLLKRFAQECGLETVGAELGQQVLEQVHRAEPAVLIIDPDLPGNIRGWEVVQSLKGNPHTSSLPIITCSWLNRTEVQALVGNVGGYLQKPDLHYDDFAQALRATGVAIENRAAVHSADGARMRRRNGRVIEAEPRNRLYEEAAMDNVQNAMECWDIELESKPDFNQAMKRIYAWYEQQIVDRPPVRFTRHNAEFEAADSVWKPEWRSLQDKWFDEEYQLERFLTQVKGKRYQGETFPVFWPNLGPSVFSAFYGCPLEFGEVTSWAVHTLHDYAQPIALDWQSAYMLKLESLTRAALEVCEGKFLVGYTDLHSGLDWLAGLRWMEPVLLDLLDDPAQVKELLRRAGRDFLQVFDHFDALLKAKAQPSVTWMGIPSFGTMHIPSCDFATMISPRQFREFALPALLEEVKPMTHNVFHVDGKGVARHIEAILEMPNVQAIQWVQGVGMDVPIMQWLPLIRRIQAAGKSVVVDLHKDELEDFIGAMTPEGILLTMASDNEEEEQAILKRVAKW
jgi:CheY-like chemotaxis protein